MKLGSLTGRQLERLSLPVWGEWIEIDAGGDAHGGGGGLSPCGESGLKSRGADGSGSVSTSLPVWGEWIEIRQPFHLRREGLVSPRVGRVD